MTFHLLRSGLFASVGTRQYVSRRGLPGLTICNAHAACSGCAKQPRDQVSLALTSLRWNAAAHKHAIFRPLVTRTAAQREHAETDNLDQKDLTKQKG